MLHTQKSESTDEKTDRQVLSSTVAPDAASQDPTACLRAPWGCLEDLEVFCLFLVFLIGCSTDLASSTLHTSRQLLRRRSEPCLQSADPLLQNFSVLGILPPKFPVSDSHSLTSNNSHKLPFKSNRMFRSSSIISAQSDFCVSYIRWFQLGRKSDRRARRV